MTWEKRVSASGSVVRAGLGWGAESCLAGETIHARLNCSLWETRLHAAIPMLRINPPPGIDLDSSASEHLEMVDRAWRAAGVYLGDPAPQRAKPLAANNQSVLKGLAVLDQEGLDCWTWALYAIKNHKGQYAPNKATWFSEKRVRERAEWCTSERPPRQGWIIPTPESSELVRVRQQLQQICEQNLLAEPATVSELMDQVCTEKQFCDKLDRLHVVLQQHNLSIEKLIEKGQWPWPTKRATGYLV
jgi:hypothetical protein